MGGASTNSREPRFSCLFSAGRAGLHVSDVPGRRGSREGEAALRRNKRIAPPSPAPAPETPWNDRVDAFMAAEELKGRSPRSLALHRESFVAARRQLDAVRAPADPLALERTHLAAMVLHMRQQGLQPRTINLRLQTLQQFFALLCAEGLRPENPAAATPRQREPHRAPRALADDEVVRLLRQPDRTTFAGLRDYVMLLLLLDTGMRLRECLAVELDDLDLEHRCIRLRAEETKTREGRTVFVSAETVTELKGYLKVRGPVATRRLFISWDEAALSPDTVHGRISQYAAAAMVKATPHVLRHTFARMYLMGGGDAFSLQQLLGHRDAASTAVYARLWARDLQALHDRHAPVARLHLPSRP